MIAPWRCGSDAGAVGAHPHRRRDRRRVADHPGVGVVQRRPRPWVPVLLATSRPPSSGALREAGDVLDRVGDVVGDVGGSITCSPWLAGVAQQHRARRCRRPSRRSAAVVVDAAGGEGGEADAPGGSGASRTRRCRSSRRRPALLAIWPAVWVARRARPLSHVSGMPAAARAIVGAPSRARPRRPGRRTWCSATW